MSSSTQSNNRRAQSGGYTSWVRRADVSLRAAYPNLVTKIFEVLSNQFVIVFDKSLQDASKIDFDEVRPVTLQAQISNEVPPFYIREIEPIRDDDIARHYEGFPFTVVQLFNLIVGRFPDLPVVDIRDGGNPMAITVELTAAISNEAKTKLLDFCVALGGPAPFRLSVTGRTLDDIDKSRNPNVMGHNCSQSDALFITASRLRRGVPKYVREDEDFWFSNLEEICAGKMAVEEMPGILEGESRCFVDATIGTHINLRQLVAYYDTIYFSPPLLEGHQDFLNAQALSEADLLELIASGRLKVLLTQAEERLSAPFLSAAMEHSPSGVIGRRTAAAMLIADIVDTAKRYRLNDLDHYADVGQFSRALSEDSELPAEKILQFILWPVKARRDIIWPLLDRGTKGIPTVGLGPYLAMLIKKIGGKDLDLEVLMISEKVHIAHAIGATCFPMREEPAGLYGLANMIGDALNFFRHFDSESAAAWMSNVERKHERKVLLPPLPLMEFDVGVPISEILATTERRVMRNRGRALFSRLAQMTDEERDREIQDINASLRQFGRPAGIVSLDTLDTVVSLLAIVLGVPYPPIGGLVHLAQDVSELARQRHPRIDKWLEEVGSIAAPHSQNRNEIDFLSRINRVAVLNTRRVS